MVQTRNGTAVAVTKGSKALSHANLHRDVVTLVRRENVSSFRKASRHDVPKLVGCLLLLGISWALVLCNIVINIRNGQRLSIDEHGWLMNGVIVGTLSLAPTAAVGFAGYHWARGRRALAMLAVMAAIPLVAFNLWSASEYVGDQMLGRQQLQGQRFMSDQQLAEMSNTEVLRSKREAETTLWKAWAATRDPTEKTRIEKQLREIRGEAPTLRAAMEAGVVGARASWLSRRWGWDKETIEGVTPMAVPVLMQMVELVFSFLGLSAWPRKHPTERHIEFNRIQPEFSMEDARRDIVQLGTSGALDGMRLSKADFAERWQVPRSTAWNWLQRFKREGLIDHVATGMRNATTIRSRPNSTMEPRAWQPDRRHP
jgi:Homeodomain-like domain